MILGPLKIIVCPNCNGLARYMTLVSGNTFGARVWTDGKKIAPMLLLPPAVVKCRHCEECYWLAEAEEVGTTDWQDDPKPANPAWTTAENVQEPTEEEYYQALEKGLATSPEQERTLRVFAWWRRNDAFRSGLSKDAIGIPSTSGTWRKNLEDLLPLLNEENENDRLMKAEVLRELGEFGVAKQILSRVDSNVFADVVRQLRSLCDGSDVVVRELLTDA